MSKWIIKLHCEYMPGYSSNVLPRYVANEWDKLGVEYKCESEQKYAKRFMNKDSAAFFISYYNIQNAKVVKLVKRPPVVTAKATEKIDSGAKRGRLRSMVLNLVDHMDDAYLSPDEVVSCAQAAASLYRMGPKAVKQYIEYPNSNVGTDDEVVL